MWDKGELKRSSMHSVCKSKSQQSQFSGSAPDPCGAACSLCVHAHRPALQDTSCNKLWLRDGLQRRLANLENSAWKNPKLCHGLPETEICAYTSVPLICIIPASFKLLCIKCLMNEEIRSFHQLQPLYASAFKQSHKHRADLGRQPEARTFLLVVSLGPSVTCDF